MQIITSVPFNEDRHELIEFLKKDVNPFVIKLMDPRKIYKAVNGTPHLTTIRTLINTYWSSIKVGNDIVMGMYTPVLLEDDLWTHVHLIVNGRKDKFVILVSGKGDTAVYLHFGFLGLQSTFDWYMKQIKVSDFEVYSNITTYIPDEEPL